MNIETLKTIIKVLEFAASDNATRYQLQHARLTKSVVEASDGYILAQSKIDDSGFADVDQIFVHRDQLPFLKQCAKNKTHFTKYVVDKNELKLNGVIVSTDGQNINYPNLERLIPKSTPKHVVAFNPEYLLNLCRSLSTGKALNCKLELPEDSTAPIRVTVQSSQNSGVLMPVRI